MRTKSHARIVGAIIVLAFLLRLGGIFGQGYPFSFYPDESNNVDRAVRFYHPERGMSLNPHWFHKPALTYYINFGAFGFYYLGGRYVTGTWETPGQFAVAFMNDKGPFYVIARLVNVLFSVWTVLLVYRLARSYADRSTATAAALFLALCVGHVAWSQVVKEDVIATFFMTLGLVFTAKFDAKGRSRDAAFAAAAVGFGFAAKYHPVVLLPALALAVFVRARERESGRVGYFLRGGVMVTAAFLVFAFIGSPYNFLDPMGRDNTARIFGFSAKMLGFGAGEVDPTKDGVASQIGRVVKAMFGFGPDDWAFTVPAATLAVVGLAIFWLRRRGRGARTPILTFAVAVLALAIANEQFPRKNHTVLLYPLLALFAAFAADFVVAAWNVAGRGAHRLTPLVVAALVAFFPAPGFPAYETLGKVIENAREPSQLAAFRFVQEHIPAGATIVNDAEILPLRLTDERRRWLDARIADLERRAVLRLERAETPRDRAWEAQAIERYHGYALQSRLFADADRHLTERRYDVLVLDHVWQTENPNEVADKTAAYNDLWSRDPLVVPLDVPDEHRHLPSAYRVEPKSLPESRRNRTPVLDGRPADFLVSSRISYGNFDPSFNKDAETKRQNWPAWVAFYDELSAHYDAWEINGDGRMPGPTMRIFDLRRRVEVPTITTVRP